MGGDVVVKPGPTKYTQVGVVVPKEASSRLGSNYLDLLRVASKTVLPSALDALVNRLVIASSL